MTLAEDLYFTGNTLPTGTVSFGAFENTKTITVSVAGDTTVETHETFELLLSTPSADTSIDTATAQGTIQADDAIADLVAANHLITTRFGNLTDSMRTMTIVSRSARTPDAPTMRWVGSSDGTFTIQETSRQLPGPGTEVLITPGRARNGVSPCPPR